MKNWIAIVSIAGVLACFGTPVRAQDLGPHVKTIRDGIYVYAVDEENSNVTIIRTEQGMTAACRGDRRRKALPQPAAVSHHPGHPCGNQNDARVESRSRHPRTWFAGNDEDLR